MALYQKASQYTCANIKCGRFFYYTPLHTGIGNINFCTRACKESHVYNVDDAVIIAPIPRKKQCPHCGKLFNVTNPTQKICQNADCKEAQRKLKRFKSFRDIPKIITKVTEEITMSEKQRAVYTFKRDPVGCICSECDISFTARPNMQGLTRKHCGSEACKSSFMKKYSRAVYERKVANLTDEERKAQNNAAYRRKQERLKVQRAELAKLKELSLSTVTVMPESVPVKEESLVITSPSPTTQSVGISDKVKHHLDALVALLNPNSKYQSLINYLEANKIDDMAKMSELMAIIARINT